MNEDLYQLSQEVSTASSRYTSALSDLAFSQQEVSRTEDEILTKRRELQYLENHVLAVMRIELCKKKAHANLCSSMLEKAKKELQEFAQESEEDKMDDPGPESMTAGQRNDPRVYTVFVGRFHRPPTY
jgi:hypothetical protein